MVEFHTNETLWMNEWEIGWAKEGMNETTIERMNK